MKNVKTDKGTELKILALLVRGDTYKSISEQTDVSIFTVNAIRKRNLETIANMKKELQVINQTSASKLLDKAHKLIDTKLSKQEDSERQEIELFERFEKGEINFEEYSAGLYRLPKTGLVELVSVAKEMFHESQIEKGKPTNISSNPQEAKNELDALMGALNSSDEVELQRIIFRKPDQLPHEAKGL